MRIAAAGGGQGEDVARDAETAVPQMRTGEFGKGMARRIDSEVREQDGVTRNGGCAKMVPPAGNAARGGDGASNTGFL
jgi:hypothetical protein